MILYTIAKKPEMEIFAFCVITFETNQNLDLLAPHNDSLNHSFLKDAHTIGEKMARNCGKTIIYEEHSF
jgi:hypothetical protein